MFKPTSTAILFTLLTTAAVAHADVAADKAELWQRTGQGGRDVPNRLELIGYCLSAYDRLHAAGVADSETIVVDKDADYHGMKPGTYTVGQLHATCLANQAKAQAVKDAEAAEEARKRAINNVASFAGLVRQEIADLDGGKDTTNMKKFAENCHQTVADARAAGFSDSTPVMVSMYASPEWHGTLAEVDVVWCKAGDDRFAKYRAERIGPYIKAGLKNDKLSMIEEVYPEPYYLAGGRGTTDPAQLAKAKVWFWDSPFDDACAIRRHGDDGEVRYQHVLHRYQFDGQGTLVKETTKTFCGDPPSKAYR